jgi:hypothetical protein
VTRESAFRRSARLSSRLQERVTPPTRPATSFAMLLKLNGRLCLWLIFSAVAHCSHRYNLSDPQDASAFARLASFSALEPNSSITIDYTSRSGRNATVTYARGTMTAENVGNDRPQPLLVQRDLQPREPASWTYLPGRRQSQPHPALNFSQREQPESHQAVALGLFARNTPQGSQ